MHNISSLVLGFFVLFCSAKLKSTKYETRVSFAFCMPLTLRVYGVCVSVSVLNALFTSRLFHLNKENLLTNTDKYINSTLFVFFCLHDSRATRMDACLVVILHLDNN